MYIRLNVQWPDHVNGTPSHNLQQPAQEIKLLARVTSPESQPANCKSDLQELATDPGC